MNNNFPRIVEETAEQYISRIITAKLTGAVQLTWDDIASAIDCETNIHKAGSTWRKSAKKYLLQDVKSSDDIDAKIDELRSLIKEMYSERIKLADERTQNRAYLRRMYREDTLVEIAREAAEKIGKDKLLPQPRLTQTTKGKREAILELSDWHYGLEVNNHWNTFNPDICKERVSKLLGKVVEFCSLHQTNLLHVVNLSDLIAGRIHSTIRLESRCDVITQSIHVAEILAEALTYLNNHGIEVMYYDCLDNHSRLEPLKSESLELESLVRIIPWYLKTRLANHAVTIVTNEYSDDIITFNALDGKYRIAGVHGHKDKPGSVVKNLTLMTREQYDLILTAHLHHFSCDEQNETLVISNGSLMGTDRYAKDLRLSSRASQNIILVTEDSVADDIKRIVLN